MASYLGDVFGDVGEEQLQMMWMRELADTKSLCNEIQAMVSDRTQMLRRGEDAAKLSALTRRYKGEQSQLR